jgi:hypothetical protein
MLLNEFLKKHRDVQKLEATLAQQQKEIQSPHCKPERAGIPNPKGERPP